MSLEANEVLLKNLLRYCEKSAPDFVDSWKKVEEIWGQKVPDESKMVRRMEGRTGTQNYSCDEFSKLPAEIHAETKWAHQGC